MDSGSRKSWQDKLREPKGLPKVVKLKEKASKRWGGNTMVVPAPQEVEYIMRHIPEGKLTTVNQIRSFIARKHRTDICCPVTAGIFIWIISNAAAEQERQGRKNVTPFWRTLKSDGSLNEKYPGGIKKQQQLLEREGHVIIERGAKRVVDHFELALVTGIGG
jgi:alkylated DNA nucleotide flippase Atl1